MGEKDQGSVNAAGHGEERRDLAELLEKAAQSKNKRSISGAASTGSEQTEFANPRRK